MDFISGRVSECSTCVINILHQFSSFWRFYACQTVSQDVPCEERGILIRWRAVLFISPLPGSAGRALCQTPDRQHMENGQAPSSGRPESCKQIKITLIYWSCVKTFFWVFFCPADFSSALSCRNVYFSFFLKMASNPRLFWRYGRVVVVFDGFSYSSGEINYSAEARIVWGLMVCVAYKSSARLTPHRERGNGTDTHGKKKKKH